MESDKTALFLQNDVGEVHRGAFFHRVSDKEMGGHMQRSQVLMWAVVGALAAPVTHAQKEDEVIGHIIVTAQKRESTLQDVPFSVAAMTDEQLRNAGATNIVDLARNVAGLTITDLGPGQSQVAIRGVSAGQVIRDQPGVKESVGIYLDESPISIALFTPDLELFDLERVEVLRGPQGTLFGAGSAAGTVRYITAQPQLGEFEGAAEADLLTGSGVDVGGGLRAALNVPLGDTTAMRLVGYHNELPGFIDSVYPGRGQREDVNGGTRTGGRVSLLFQPSEQVSITPRIVYQKLETDGFPRVDVFNILGNPYTTTQPAIRVGEREQVTQIGEGLEDDFLLADLRMEFGIGDFTLTSITSYTDREVTVVRDATQLTGSVSFSPLGGGPADVRLDAPLIDETTLDAFSQEFRFSGGSDESVSWVVGSFFQMIDRDYSQTLPTPGFDAFLIRQGVPPSVEFNAPPNMPYYSVVPYDFEQFAFFGEATVRLDDEWSVTGGLRYYDFDEDRLLTFAGVFADFGYQEEPGSTSSSGFSPRVIVAYEPNENALVTVQASRGFRLGGINDPLNVTLCQPQDLATFSGQPTFDDEQVMNYEVGGKFTLAEGRISLNTAVFYSDIEDLQVVADAGTCSSRVILNAQGESMGVEAEMFARLGERWNVGLSATYVQAEINETRRSQSGAVIAGIRDGNRLPTSPEFQAAASIGYSQPLTSTFDLFGNFTYQYVGSSYTQLADQEPGVGTVSLFQFGGPLTQNTFTFNPELPSYDIANLRVGVRSETWEAAAFVNNLWDERAFLSLDRERGLRARVAFLTNMPRSYGVMVRYSF
jgi:iron complex outermembrane receptor protein